MTYNPVLTRALPVPAWHRDALCAQIDPELFFPLSEAESQTAREVCQSCPVVSECLEWALSQSNIEYGVWGGTTERERRAIRRQHGLLLDTNRS